MKMNVFQRGIQKIHTHLQRGILQEIVYVTVGVLCFSAMGLVLYFIGKHNM